MLRFSDEDASESHLIQKTLQSGMEDAVSIQVSINFSYEILFFNGNILFCSYLVVVCSKLTINEFSFISSRAHLTLMSLLILSMCLSNILRNWMMKLWLEHFKISVRRRLVVFIVI